MEKNFELTKEQEEILMEVGDLGTRHAVLALSKMTGEEVTMIVKDVSITPTEELSKMIKTVDEIVFSAYVPIYGIIPGSMMTVTPVKSGCTLIDMIMHNPIGTTNYLDRMGESVLAETQNIIGNAFLTALNKFTSISFLPGIPKVARIYKEDAHTFVQSAFGPPAGETVLTITTEFSVKNVKGLMIIAVALESTKPIIRAIKEELAKRALKK